MGFVYAVTCIKTGEQYIGSACSTPEARWRNHQNAMRGGYAPRRLQACADQHGWKNFRFEVLVECDNHQEIEIAVIRDLDPELNHAYTSRSVYEMTKRQKILGRKRKRYLVGSESLTKPEIIERYGRHVLRRIYNGERGDDAIRPRSEHREQK